MNWAFSQRSSTGAEGVLRERSCGLPGEGRPNQQPQQQRIEYLEKKIQTKDEVLLN